MNEPTESEFEISVPEATASRMPAAQEPQATTDAAPEAAPIEVPAAELPPEEPEIVRHDPFAYMRGAPWMNRKLGPSGRAAAFLRRELKTFPVIEGREPNGADLDAIVKRTVDTMVPIFKREQATDIAYDELEKRRAARIAAATAAAPARPWIGTRWSVTPDRRGTTSERRISATGASMWCRSTCSDHGQQLQIGILGPVARYYRASSEDTFGN